MNARLTFSLTLVAALALGTSAHAQQYKSEARVLNAEEAAQTVEEFDAQKALKKLDNNPYGKSMALRQLAAEALAAKDTPLAVRYLKQAVALNALSKFAMQEMQRELAILLVNQGEYETVIKTLAPMVRGDDDPDSAVLLALAGSYANLERYREAAPLMDKALAKRSDPPDDWLGLAGAIKAGLKDWDAAAELYERAIRKNSLVPNYWRELARIHMAKQRPIKAAAAYEGAYRLGLLERTEDRINYAQALIAAGVPFDAATLLQAWLDDGFLVPDPDTLEITAHAFLTARETFLAIPALEDAARASGKAELYLQLGQMYFDRSEWDQAESSLAKALNKGAGSHAGAARIMRGVALYQLGRLDDARHSFARAAESSGSRNIADQWISYIDSGIARESALRMAQRRASEPEFGRGRFEGAGRRRSSASETAATKGPKYTPVGAIRAGNFTGTIPTWTGGLDKPPGEPGKRLANPFSGDAPLFVVNADNAKDHEENLSQGHKLLLRRFPDYKISVYPTRRSVAYPEAIYEATELNQKNAELLGSDQLVGARLGFPFPQPDSGVQIMWNHRVRYRGDGFIGTLRQAVVRADGSSDLRASSQRVLYRYANLEDPADLSKENVIAQVLLLIGESVNLPEIAILVHETANSVEQARAIWALPTDLGKMIRIPPVGYDQDMYGTESVATVDMFDMYNGAFDRYDWKLVGKREMLVPYNSFAMHDAALKPDILLKPGFPNPAPARYELHRVWVIEASERGGKRHRYPIRRIYVDEDSWNIVMIEHYDGNGKMMRFQEGHLLPVYDQQFTTTMPVVVFDLTNDRYFITGLTNVDPWPQMDARNLRMAEFRPASVRARYSR